MDSDSALPTVGSRVGLRLGAAITVLILAACSTPAGAPAGTPPPTAPQSSSVPASSSAAADEISGLFTVGSRKMYLECRGSGSPTVVLESGFRSAGDVWRWTDVDSASVVPGKDPTSVYTGTAGFTRVCAYDRPGSLRALDDKGVLGSLWLPGRSDPAPMPRTGADVVRDLHELLATAEVPGPYILVGHSIGGLLSLLYARTYPDQVAGLVLVDATLPTLKQAQTPQRWEESLTVLTTPGTEIWDYAEETLDVDTAIEQLEALAALSKKPVMMLRAAKHDPDDADWPAWRTAHTEFARSIPGARLTIVPETDHFIHLERPDVVIDTIRSLV